MKMKLGFLMILFNFLLLSWSLAQDGSIPAFKLGANDLELHRLAQSSTPFNKAGRKFAILGFESGSFEAWAYPLKLIRNFEFSFLVGSSTRLIHGKDIVRYISVTPEATILTYTYQSFTVRAIYITPFDERGALILLDVDSTEPLTIICGFLPILQPMWPAGIGGQYAYWDNKLKAYIISEPTGNNHGFVGSSAASGVSYTPAHMLSDAPNEFKIELKNPETVKYKYIPIILTGGKGKRDDVKKVYHRLSCDPETYYRKTAEHYRNLRLRTLRVETPNRELNLAFEWAKITFDNLVVDNPDLGKGLVAGLGASGTSGRPGFGWFFGGDAYINCFSINSYCDYQTVRDALAFTQKWQREDGKMAHELSQAASYVDWFGKYHYGYIHGDTSPYYITAVYDYYKMSGDVDFVKQSWQSLKKAYEWCLSTDANGDGLMDNKKAGLGALEYGALTGIESDIYMSAVWVRAAYAMQFLSKAAGEKPYVKKATKHYKKAKKIFNEKFWDEEIQYYAYAFNAKNEHVKEISPWNAVGLMWEISDPQRSVKSLEKISSADLTTDWGIRSISYKSKYYQPLNYNYGAVWPFLTSWVATAQYKHHLILQGYNSLMSTVRHTFDNAPGCITEVFSGSYNIYPQEAVCQQGFSTAGVVLPFVRGMLGLEGDAIHKTITFAPHFPANWEYVSIDNYQICKAIFSFNYTRGKDRITIDIQSKQSDGYMLQIAPALGVGSVINKVIVNGEATKFEQVFSTQTVQPIVNIASKGGSATVEIEFNPTVEILPPYIETKTGDMNKGLKIISLRREEDHLKVDVEGLSGKSYVLEVVNPELIHQIKGASHKGNRIDIKIPDGKEGDFIGHEIIIKTE
ncbi:MAG: hypothetical protein DRP89_01080 [Candidatus Neomarinimicrobiota bacterium]|nr:MAG: hypothetical protein DRP89_01080 [Candidatus Neomarinimicrobiota bacterium]